jgi:hypothetical protein
MNTGRFREGAALVEEGISAAERLGLDEWWVRLQNLRGSIRLNFGDNGGFDDLDRAAARARELRSYEQLQSCINNRLTHEVAHGRLTDARASQVELEENLKNDPVAGRRRWVAASALELAYLSGDWDEARARIEDYLAELTPDAPHVLATVVRSFRLLIRQTEAEQPDAAEEAESLLHGEGPGMGAPMQQSVPPTARTLLDCGRRERAEALLDEILAPGDSLIGVLNDAPIVDAAWLAVDLGRADEIAPLLEAGTQIPWAVAGAAICAGDFIRAADVMEEVGFRPGEAYARLRAARQLVEEGRRAEADVQLQRSLAFWREVGATRYVREGEALLAASA